MSTPASGNNMPFDTLRRRTGFILAPALFLGLWLLPIPGLADPAHRMLAILGAVVILWLTEAIPMAVTALLGPSLCVILGVESARHAFKNFADPIIFLFIGSFLIAEAMLRHGLNRRVAFHMLSLPGVGESPGRLLAVFALITGAISMWISNTATTAMMLPIGISILTGMAHRTSEREGRNIPHTALAFGTGLMLMATFASSIGGLGTPVGTPPNLVGSAIIEKQLGIRITFFQWMAFGTPLAILVIGFLIFSIHRSFATENGLLTGTTGWLREQEKKLGPLSRSEKNILLAFGLTVFLWILPGLVSLTSGTDAATYKWLDCHLPEAVVGLLGAILLFLLPTGREPGEFTLSWEDARRLDWGTILLFGGGLCLGELMFSTGLAEWLGRSLAGLVQARSVPALVILFTGVAILASETTSNVASATMVVPVAIAVAKATGVDPFLPALASCLGASFGFMMPVSTAPNAMAYGSGCVPLLQMVKHGILLDLLGWVAVVVTVLFWVPCLFS